MDDYFFNEIKSHPDTIGSFMQSGRKSARFACAEGVRLPEREARTPEGPQGAEPSGTVVERPLPTLGVN